MSPEDKPTIIYQQNWDPVFGRGKTRTYSSTPVLPLEAVKGYWFSESAFIGDFRTELADHLMASFQCSSTEALEVLNLFFDKFLASMEEKCTP